MKRWSVRFAPIARYPTPLRMGLFLLALLLIWLPFATPVYALVKNPNTVTLIVMPILFLEFLGLIQIWGRWVYGESHLLKRYGLDGSRQQGMDWLQGLGLGLASLFSLFLLQGGLGWLAWQSAPPHVERILLEGFLVGAGVGFAEELVFRGWIADELRRDYSPTVVLWGSSLVFALLHFIKPIGEILRTFPQFPGLILLGLALMWGKWGSQGRLGWPMGLHGGLVWGFYIVNVGGLIHYTGRVPEWITGIDRNPLSGLMGLLFLSALALGMRLRCRRKG